MRFRFSKFALPRAAKSGLVGLAMVLISGGVWQSRLLDGFAICAPSPTTAGSASAAAATPAPMKEGAMASDMHAPTVFTLRTGVAEGRLVYFGVGGPNFTSSFHLIGEMFDRVYQGGGLASPPLTGVQPGTVPPGGSTVVDLKVRRAGRCTLVDHALSRIERGLVRFLIVDGPRDDDIMHAGPALK